MHDFMDLIQTAMVFVFIIGIVWMKQRNRLESKRMDITAQDSAEKATHYATRMAEMEDRLRVLERVITDKGYDVATQIEALRDQRRVEERFDELEDRRKVR